MCFLRRGIFPLVNPLHFKKKFRIRKKYTPNFQAALMSHDCIPAQKLGVQGGGHISRELTCQRHRRFVSFAPNQQSSLAMVQAY